MTLTVQYSGDIHSTSGYARAVRNNIRALHTVGVKVHVSPIRFDTIQADYDPFWREHVNSFCEPAPTTPTIKIHHSTPELFDPTPGHINIGYTVCETDTILNWEPQVKGALNWVKQCNRMNRIWTASKFCKGVFEKSGVTVPIDIIPHPIDLELYSPVEEKTNIFNIHDYKNKMIFLSVFQWNARKDPEKLLTCWWHTFWDDPNAVLMLKTYTRDFDELRQLTETVQKLKFSANVRQGPKNVILIHANIAEASLPKMYRSSDVLITTTRGEGFGLPMQEAQACGIPTIYPDATSLPEFCVGYPTETVKEPCGGVGSPWYTTEMMWNTIRADKLIDNMRKARKDWLENKKSVPKTIRAKARTAVECYSYTELGKKMTTILSRL